MEVKDGATLSSPRQATGLEDTSSGGGRAGCCTARITPHSRAGRGPVKTRTKGGLASRIPMMMNEDTMSVLLYTTASNHMWPQNK